MRGGSPTRARAYRRLSDLLSGSERAIAAPSTTLAARTRTACSPSSLRSLTSHRLAATGSTPSRDRHPGRRRQARRAQPRVPSCPGPRRGCDPRVRRRGAVTSLRARVWKRARPLAGTRSSRRSLRLATGIRAREPRAAGRVPGGIACPGSRLHVPVGSGFDDGDRRRAGRREARPSRGAARGRALFLDRRLAQGVKPKGVGRRAGCSGACPSGAAGLRGSTFVVAQVPRRRRARRLCLQLLSGVG